MARIGLQGHLILRPENRRYLSGFTAGDGQIGESSGCLLITPRKQYLLTDSRYEIQARREAKGFSIEIYTAGLPALLAQLIKRHRIAKLGFEDDLLTVAAHADIKKACKPVKLAPARGLVENQRQSKDPTEIRAMVKALRITEAALAQTIEFMKPGHTEMEVARFLGRAMMSLGAEGLAFPSIVASGPNAALPHAYVTDRKIKESETIIFDCGARYKGYRADLSRTIIIGSAPNWIKNIYNLVREAQLNAIQGIKPGQTTDHVDSLARDLISAQGYGANFGHGLGHGVGLATHEAPSLSPRQSVQLKEGMIVTVEPGIYLEGRGGVRLEEMVLLTSNGARLLNQDRTFYEF